LTAQLTRPGADGIVDDRAIAAATPCRASVRVSSTARLRLSTRVLSAPIVEGLKLLVARLPCASAVTKRVGPVWADRLAPEAIPGIV
jgi:hypothetical protein